MTRESQETRRPDATPLAGAAKVKTVACLGGVSLERDVPSEEIRDYIRDPGTLVWVDVQDPGPGELVMLSEEFGFHPLALEDAATGQQRPKMDEYKGYTFVVTYGVVPGADTTAPRTFEVDLFIGRNYVVSIHRGRVPALEGALGRWTRASSARISGRSRRSLTTPPNHKRVLTISASAIQTIPPWRLTRHSSAWTCPRSRGCSTRCACTA